MAGNLVANLTKLPQEAFCTAFLIGASQAPLATPVADISSGNELICYFPTLWPSGRSLLKYGGKFGGQSDKIATGGLLHSSLSAPAKRPWRLLWPTSPQEM